MLNQIFDRDGLKRRDGILNLTQQAINRLVELGHHPHLGARALKRVVEREVVQPLSSSLSAIPPGSPMITTIDAVEGKFDLSVQELRPVERSIFWPEQVSRMSKARPQTEWSHRILDGIRAALDRIEVELENDAPPQKLEISNLSAAQARYFYCREQLKKVDRILQAAVHQNQPKQNSFGTRRPKSRPIKITVKLSGEGNPQRDLIRESIHLKQSLDDLDPELFEVPDLAITAVLRELALLEALASKPGKIEAGLLVFSSYLDSDMIPTRDLSLKFKSFFEQIWGFRMVSMQEYLDSDAQLVKRIPASSSLQAFFLEGLNLPKFLPFESTILIRRSSGRLGLVRLKLRPVESEKAARSTLKQLILKVGDQQAGEFGPVMHQWTENKQLEDFRTGVGVRVDASEEEFRAFILSSLSLPSELAETIRPTNTE